MSAAAYRRVGPSAPGAELRVAGGGLGSVDRGAWDAFAHRHRASLRLTTAHLSAWALKHALRWRVRLYVVTDPDGVRVAQGAVASRGTRRVFLDRLVTREDAGDGASGVGLWRRSMEAILREIGPCEVAYGWELSMEPPREDTLALMAGVEVIGVRPLIVEAVDFSAWASWEDYWRSVSTNVRRNVKKAENDIPGLSLDVRTGWSCLGHVATIVRLRSRMYRRKELAFRPLPALVSAAAGVLFGGRHVLTAVVRSDEGPLAAFNGADFAGTTYYTEGGSEASPHGAAWYLVTEMARRAYTAHPDGRFLMGYVEPAIHDEAVGGGLLRSRRSMRVSAYPTSVVSFRWAEPTGGEAHG